MKSDDNDTTRRTRDSNEDCTEQEDRKNRPHAHAKNGSLTRNQASICSLERRQEENDETKHPFDTKKNSDETKKTTDQFTDKKKNSCHKDCTKTDPIKPDEMKKQQDHDTNSMKRRSSDTDAKGLRMDPL